MSIRRLACPPLLGIASQLFIIMKLSWKWTTLDPFPTAFQLSSSHSWPFPCRISAVLEPLLVLSLPHFSCPRATLDPFPAAFQLSSSHSWPFPCRISAVLEPLLTLSLPHFSCPRASSFLHFDINTLFAWHLPNVR